MFSRIKLYFCVLNYKNMTEGTIAEILGLTNKQIEEFGTNYQNGINFILMGAERAQCGCRLLSEKEPIYLDLVFGKENGVPTLLRFKKLDEEKYEEFKKDVLK